MSSAALATVEPERIAPVRRPTGRPLKFPTPHDLETAINAYFQSVPDGKPLTIAGMAYALDVDCDTILNYQGRDRFFGVMKRARDRIRAQWESRLFANGQAAGAIFWLKNNAGYRDVQEVQHTAQIVHVGLPGQGLEPPAIDAEIVELSPPSGEPSGETGDCS